jgi:hypothetical protein
MNFGSLNQFKLNLEIGKEILIRNCTMASNLAQLPGSNGTWPGCIVAMHPDQSGQTAWLARPAANMW